MPLGRATSSPDAPPSTSKISSPAEPNAPPLGSWPATTLIGLSAPSCLTTNPAKPSPEEPTWKSGLSGHAVEIRPGRGSATRTELGPLALTTLRRLSVVVHPEGGWAARPGRTSLKTPINMISANAVRPVRLPQEVRITAIVLRSVACAPTQRGLGLRRAPTE